ncbi:hypothetical protein [Halodesulfovibrio sp. MK-HDV]|jgi:hypothetical protein|uniref:hypothetical protein n=1 Tax=Halodesulfovibrio sp. MK-HDV TaxID=2599925 RepID=UPI00136BF0F2|nr:hypothetical protein [Halodesulfovibrio sp. MK-HDV]KAF1073882.1 hypothetical protein MKHDV_03222 [Halodesulfovibrio sp. MK-HDV]
MNQSISFCPWEHQCGCQCPDYDQDFDQAIAKELNAPLTLEQIQHTNITWFASLEYDGDHFIKDLGITTQKGLYIIWNKDDYCPNHQLFQMTALYVGKGDILNRMVYHVKTKDFGENINLYATYLEFPNRIAKYVEQLLLDLYDFPMNTFENYGEKPLYAFFTQCEVD